MYPLELEPTHSVTVLAVADGSMRCECRSALESVQVEVHEAVTTDDLLTLARSHRPDLVIADVRAGEGAGECALDELQRDPTTCDTPILALCEPEQLRDVIPRLRAGYSDYLAMPFSSDEFLFRVRTLVQCGLVGAPRIASSEMFGENTRLLSLLLDFSAVLARVHDLDTLVAETLQVTAEVSGCRCVAILLPREDEPVLFVHGCMGFEGTDLGDLVVPVGEGVAGRVFKSGGRFIARHAAHDEIPYGDSAVHDLRFYAKPPALALAVRSSERSVGVLHASHRVSGRPFADYELLYLNLICNCAGAAIHGMNERVARDSAYEAITVSLASLAEHRHDETGRHLERMTGYCLILANQLQQGSLYASLINRDFLENLRRAAPLHDIGKVAVPDHILYKKGRLTPDEMRVMRTHARIGADAIRAARSHAYYVPFLRMAEDIAVAHHEWVDGSGYPAGLEGSDIPLPARIAAVADVYDALTSRRVYKEAFSHEKAKAIIVELAGRQFDQVIVDAFLNAEREILTLADAMEDDIAGQFAPSTSKTFNVVSAHGDGERFLYRDRDEAALHKA